MIPRLIKDWWQGKPHYTRSAQWPAVRAKWLKNHPACACCGTAKNLEVHHKIPFHVNRSMELDPANLITLCERSGFGCHFFVGHLLDWRSWNPGVQLDAALWSQKVQGRAMLPKEWRP